MIITPPIITVVTGNYENFCLPHFSCVYAKMANVVHKITTALGKMGIFTDFDKFRLSISDAASYKTSAGKSLKVTFPKLLHIPCFTHIVHIPCSRVCVKIADYNTAVNDCVKNVKKVFEK